MMKKQDRTMASFGGFRFCLFLLFALWPDALSATQLHPGSEGIITHQIGHLFFLFSMVVLMVTIRGKGLEKNRGWRMIQYSAFFFTLWNLDAGAAHFLDNQLNAVKLETLSYKMARITASESSVFVSLLYYGLKLDHILCVPAMWCLYVGMSNLLIDQERDRKTGGESG